MSMPGPVDAVRKTISVRCGVEAAFRIWTEQIDTWWPRKHSRSGDPDTSVVIEPKVGGRIYERTPGGVEYDWGRVIAWDPPRYFAYHWYLGSGSEQPTQVDVHFTTQDDGTTRVEVTHRGPELIGQLWTRNSTVYDASWEVVLTAYVEACTAE